MTSERRGTANRTWVALLVVAGALAVLNAGVFAERATSLVHTYRLFITEGAEGPHIYAVWRVLNGHPLYEWPLQVPYSLTFYNALFYRTYAAFLQLAGVNGEAILYWGRVLTLGFTVTAAAVFAAMAIWLVPREERTRLVLALVALLAPVIWLGSNFTAWWALSIRPDVPAALFSLAGLWLVLRVDASGRWRSLLAASLLFFLAWAFKQSFVLTLLGSAVFFGWRRDWRALAVLVGPFTALAVVAVAIGGPEYRYNLLVAPALSGYAPRQAAAIVARVAVQNAFVWAFPVIAWLHARAQTVDTPADVIAERRDALTRLRVIAGVALMCGVAMLARAGTNKNQLFEAYVAGALLATVETIRCARVTLAPRRGRRLAVFATVLLLPMVAFPAAQLLWPNHFGVTRLAADTDLRRRAALADALAGLPKPLFIDDDILGQPWHATENRYPALVLDRLWLSIAIPPGGGQDFAKRALEWQAPRAVVATDGDPFHRAALALGMRCGPVPSCPHCDRGMVVCMDRIHREAGGPGSATR